MSIHKEVIEKKNIFPHEQDKPTVRLVQSKKEKLVEFRTESKEIREIFQSSRSGKSERIEMKTKVEIEPLFGTQALIHKRRDENNIVTIPAFVAMDTEH